MYVEGIHESDECIQGRRCKLHKALRRFMLVLLTLHSIVIRASILLRTRKGLFSEDCFDIGRCRLVDRSLTYAPADYGHAAMSYE